MSFDEQRKYPLRSGIICSKRAHAKAGDRDRTDDIQLGKLTFYH